MTSTDTAGSALDLPAIYDGWHVIYAPYDGEITDPRSAGYRTGRKAYE